MAKARRVAWRPFRIPFRGEFRASHGMMDVHEGLVVQIEDVEGNIGLGEASPLTAFTGETLDDAARFLDAWLDGLAGRPLRDPLPPGTPASLPPSAAAA
ncbi:MAG: hypothetical protein M0R74_08835, partial [Dehalococcoidia bacterium]|nr:hypothetical protein [Dehalococcoidia bacterium]